MIARPQRGAAPRQGFALPRRAAPIGFPDGPRRENRCREGECVQAWGQENACWESGCQETWCQETWCRDHRGQETLRGEGRALSRGADRDVPHSGSHVVDGSIRRAGMTADGRVPADAGPSVGELAPASLAALRDLCRSAGGSTPVLNRAECLPLGASLDGVLGGGLARGQLHEVFSADAGGLGGVLGFAAALAAGARGPVVWVRQDMAVSETGSLYGAGCAELGIDPARLLLVEACDAASVLRAAEEALRHPAPALVIAEPWGMPRVLDLTATRRLALRAGERGTLALLLRPGAEPSPSVAATRWLIAPAASGSPLPFGLGPPAFAVELVRNRLGPLGRWIVEWDTHERRFHERRFERGSGESPAAPHGRLPAAPVHRPAPADLADAARRRA